MGVASWLLILLGLLMGPGQSGVLALTEGWVTVPSCTVVWGGWLPGAWCRKHAHCWWAAAAVVVVVVGWLVGASVRAWCVWGWHAVGVLGQCALGCPARPGFHFLGFWLGVGGLVVNCIVDASILL